MKTTRLFIALLTAAAFTALPTGPAAARSVADPVAAPHAVPGTASSASPDFDGDGLADLAAGLYLGVATDTWGVRIWYGSGAVVTIAPADLGTGVEGIDGPFLAQDMNTDGFTDLLFTSVQSDRSVVQLVYGSTSGLDLATRHTTQLPASSSTWVGDIAIMKTPARRLVVSLKLDGSAARLLVYNLAASGLPVGDPSVLLPGKGKLPKVSDTRTFGTALATWGNRLFVGSPEAKVSGKKEAGGVVAITFSTSGVSSARLVTQATKGVGGSVGSGDHFGTSLAARDGNLVVGTPGDDVGAVQRSGSLQVFSIFGDRLVPVKRIAQSTPGVPGKAEVDDRFGSSVELGNICPGVLSVVVGAAAEVITSSHDWDGSAWAIPVGKASACPARQLYEGHGFDGVPDNRGIGEFAAVVRDSGSATDELVVGGYGSESQDAGRLIRWSPATGHTTLLLDGLFTGVAGR